MAAPSVGNQLILDALPARQGDALLLTWGPPDARRRMLVDGGPATAYRFVAPKLAELVGRDPLDLLVLTHIDGDHIEGTILLTNDADLALDIREIWYNGSGKLVAELNAVHGEILSAIVQSRNIPWNEQAGGRAIRASDTGPHRTYPQVGGLVLTVLGPDSATLRRLRDEWEKVCAEEHLTFGSVEEALAVLNDRKNLKPAAHYLDQPPVPDVGGLARAVALLGKDSKTANRSSIVLLAEYEGVRVLLAGDATLGVLVPAVRRLLLERGLEHLPLSAFKLPHHGSARNVSRELLQLLPADAYVFSSDGSGFNHPDDEAVAAVLEYGKPGAELVFNYRNPRTLKWSDTRLPGAGYTFPTRYPEPGTGGVRLVFPIADGGSDA